MSHLTRQGKVLYYLVAMGRNTGPCGKNRDDRRFLLEIGLGNGHLGVGQNTNDCKTRLRHFEVKCDQSS